MKAALTPNIDRRGFSLIESLMATALLAFSAVSIISPITASYQQQAYSAEMSKAASLAKELMDEIACRPFVDPNQVGGLGPETGETVRSLFDNLDDYHGYGDSTGDLKSISGDTLENSTHDVYARSVSMVYRASPNGAEGSGDFLQATVSVTSPSGKNYALQRWFSKFDRK